MKTDYAGIDYSLGRANVDGETGIHYGVLHHGEVGEFWYEDSQALYEYYCPCGYNLGQEYPDGHCPECDRKIEEDDFEEMEPLAFYYEDGDSFYAEQGYDDPDIMILKSPYFTYAQFCSPCAPGAVYLRNSFENRWTNSGTGRSGVNSAEDYPEDYKVKAEMAGFPKGYCFGHDWFVSGKAPYPVFSVETGKLVMPKEQ